ncbi:L,D-transpeptidase family protein [Aestuariivirga sp. YIM B02566]|uniref:L,D-transpeptidase family protein n=1 Tax=Taklimakanibacter albus TaxID=2800327 RepID=A0ACC5R672_9HYPH|nr:L,D-transpeptidase family protein [Aestuariivirga sp. YIM B02566]MBK1868053.1 L,D-transpeptidase family protein [Aestuariivirga sp. YIM B02566]
MSLARLIAWAPVFILLLVAAPLAHAVENEQVAAEIRKIIDNGEPLMGDQQSDDRIVEVYVFYADDRDYKPLWVRDSGPKAKAHDILMAIKGAADMGLDPVAYRVGEIEQKLETAKTPRELAELEFLLTRAFLDFGRDINRGIVEPQTAGKENAITSKQMGALTLIDGAERADNIADYVRSLEPQTPEYQRLKSALAAYREIEVKGGFPVIGKGAALKPGMNDKRVPAIRKYLILTGDLPEGANKESDLYDADLVAAVKWFQYRHGLTEDGIMAQTTFEAMNVPVADRIQQLELNMERRRWMDDDLGKYYILVNIADQELKVVKDGKTVHTARVVVGKPFTRTPVFSEKMKYIVLNPYWNVPPNIANNEYLPKLRRDPGVLKRERIRVFAGNGDSGREVDPYSVNWSSINRMPYSLRQDSGPKNALGRVKFMFPNRFNVYLHDTPSKSLFNRDLRVFSHGCVRVQNPLELAELLLADQGWSKARIDAQIAEGGQRIINLKTQVPVHVTYMTAWANKDGSIHFRRDVYKRDEQLARVLAGAEAGG